MTGKLVYNTSDIKRLDNLPKSMALRFTATWGFVADSGDYRAICVLEGCLASIHDGKLMWNPPKQRFGNRYKAFVRLSDDAIKGIEEALRKQGAVELLKEWDDERNMKKPPSPVDTEIRIGEYVVE